MRGGTGRDAQGRAAWLGRVCEGAGTGDGEEATSAGARAAEKWRKRGNAGELPAHRRNPLKADTCPSALVSWNEFDAAVQHEVVSRIDRVREAKHVRRAESALQIDARQDCRRRAVGKQAVRLAVIRAGIDQKSVVQGQS